MTDSSSNSQIERVPRSRPIVQQRDPWVPTLSLPYNQLLMADPNQYGIPNAPADFNAFIDKPESDKIQVQVEPNRRYAALSGANYGVSVQEHQHDDEEPSAQSRRVPRTIQNIVEEEVEDFDIIEEQSGVDLSLEWKGFMNDHELRRLLQQYNKYLFVNDRLEVNIRCKPLGFTDNLFQLPASVMNEQDELRNAQIPKEAYEAKDKLNRWFRCYSKFIAHAKNRVPQLAESQDGACISSNPLETLTIETKRNTSSD